MSKDNSQVYCHDSLLTPGGSWPVHDSLPDTDLNQPDSRFTAWHQPETTELRRERRLLPM